MTYSMFSPIFRASNPATQSIFRTRARQIEEHLTVAVISDAGTHCPYDTLGDGGNARTGYNFSAATFTPVSYGAALPPDANFI